MSQERREKGRWTLSPTEWIIFAAAFFLRLLFMFFLYLKIGGNFFVDAGTINTAEYLSIGTSLAEGRGFENLGVTSALRTPVYPLFVGTFVFLHLPLWLIPLLQNIISALSAVLVYRLGTFYFSQRAGIVAGSLFALEPYNMLLANLLMTETLFIFFLLLSFIAFWRWYSQEANWRWPILTGLLLGLSTLTRPIPFFIPVIFSLFLFMKGLNRQRLRSAVGFLAVFFLVISVWSARNYLVFGRFKLSNVVETEVLYTKMLPIAVAKERGISYEQAAVEVRNNTPNLIPDFDPDKYWHTFAYNDILALAAKGPILRHLPTMSSFIFWSIFPSGLYTTGYQYIFSIFWPGWDNDGLNLSALFREAGFGEFLRALATLNIFKAIIVLGSFVWLCLYGIIIGGFIAGWSKHKKILLFFLLFVVFFLTIAVAPPMDIRYRQMSHPFIFLLVGFGIDQLTARFHKRRFLSLRPDQL